MTRTIDDWLADASRSSDPEAISRCLSAAEELATDCWHWRRLVQGLTGLGIGNVGALQRAVAGTLQAAEREADVWGFRDAASALAGSLGDVDGAARALSLGERVLSGARHVNGLVLLSQGFADTLADPGGAARCLATALAASSKPADRAYVASGYLRALHDTERAQSILGTSGHPQRVQAWSVAHWLGDGAR
jgi:hypothetical protein